MLEVRDWLFVSERSQPMTRQAVNYIVRLAKHPFQGLEAREAYRVGARTSLALCLLGEVNDCQNKRPRRDDREASR